MIDNLLDIRKFEAGKIRMAVHQYNAQELISRVAAQFARPARHDGIELSAELERIFDRYTQFNRKTERERGGGGLGLAYCKLAIESFHGMIWAECENGQGSEFVILLPCCPGSSNCSN